MENILQEIKILWESKYIKAFIFIILSIIIAKIVNLIIKFFFKKLIKKTKTDLDDKLFDIFSNPLFISIFLIGFSISIGLLDITENVLYFIFASIKTILVVMWSIVLFKSISVVLGHFAKQRGNKRFIQKKTIPIFDNTLKLILFLGSVYFIFLTWKINITGWIASAGIIGIAVGFAAKDSLANLFSGIFIIIDAPYKLGDFIILDSGERGKVNVIGLRSTRILTMDSIEITIPNSVMANTKITNESGGPSVKTRLKILVGVEYGVDIDKVKEVMLNIAIKNTIVCNEPEPKVRLIEFGDSALNMQLLCWIDKSSKRGHITDELNTTIYKEFDKNNIGIPFPQMDVNFKNSIRINKEKNNTK